MPGNEKSKKDRHDDSLPLYNQDCLDFLQNYSGPKFDLVYLDPPFFLERKFSLEASSDDVSFQGNWHDEPTIEICRHIGAASGNESLIKYLSWLFNRLVLIHKHISDTGSIFLHIGTREAPYVNLLLDNIFGMKNWRSTITWQRSHPHNNLTKSLGNVSDFIFYYSKGNDYTFNLLHTPHDETYLANSFSNQDERGKYALAPIIQEKARKGHFYEFKGVTPPNGWRVKLDTLEKLEKENRIHWGANRAYKKVYLEEAQGAALQNIWTDIHNITRTEVDNRKYPTQKPIKLLERIIELTTNPDDLVYDPFMGSGTTLVAAAKLKRRFIGTDLSIEAVRISTSRLNQVIEDKNQKLF